MNPADIQKIPDEKLVEELDKANIAIEELTAAAVTIRGELLARMQEKNLDNKVVGNKLLVRTKRFSFTGTIEEARELSCTVTKTVTKEVIDLEKVKALFSAGATKLARIDENISVRTVKGNE